MPKIIFRPNPTPPPFPPPGPVYPANSLKITPYPFNEGEECRFDIFNLQEIDDHKKVDLFATIPSEGGAYSIDNLSTDGSPIIKSVVTDLYVDSTLISNYYIEVTKNDDSTYTIPLTLV